MPYDRFFEAPIRFDQEVAALVFSAELLEHRITDADVTVRQRTKDHLCQLEGTQSSSLSDSCVLGGPGSES
ncbi:hypothetical protein [Methylobacterium sp. CM6257]